VGGAYKKKKKKKKKKGNSNPNYQKCGEPT
jgi:hypothetical protein